MSSSSWLVIDRSSLSDPRSSVVRQHADHDPLRIANEEATDAPGLVDGTVDDLVPGPDCFGVRRIDRLARFDVHSHVGQHGLRVRRREEDLRLAGPEADVTPTEGALLEAQHLRVEGARSVEVA